ncbi:hypothetical protein VOLCADRAFT_91630 [Volvox carteri f. nagariensis]|uniref:Cyclin-like domain-containing protein n=1 Tax=Volvox carteri f. nagariensis TaxID=3068 RepID=D8TXK7_VOLCA|nr:uncharacterized protein VOLCADRAFT_91630 [Volvox carteri f. nagariensis]EFJ47658.1 hypothetical protein VOLCADRAFT_91630 [Volvox carteri f. nagariensis]|eukprot:XP_002951129.1 hypothetical protein VOLCADRAFT_91630 [Volvox carteri f. nagariensis]
MFFRTKPAAATLSPSSSTACATAEPSGVQLQQQFSNIESGDVAIRPGEYYRSDAALALRNMLARQRRRFKPMATVSMMAMTMARERSAFAPDLQPSQHGNGHQLAAPSCFSFSAAAAAAATMTDQEKQQQLQQQLELQQQQHVRSVVVSWMVEVAAAFRLSPATLCLAVELFDCYMDKQAQPPPHSMMQLLALTCLSLATRLEDLDHRFTLRDWASLALDRHRGVLLYEVQSYRCCQVIRI